ncbi:MAG: ABC transporter ATP-binding protein [Anaerovorax sp.]
MAEMEPLLRINELNFNDQISYDSMEIDCEKVTFLCGESGCGKSTLLKMINGTLTPTSGEILYKNQNIAEWDTIQLRKEISLVSQEVFLFEGTIEENFQWFYQYREEPLIEKEGIYRLLALCKLDFPLHKIVTTMSGGERQRLYMAVFLSFLPKVILLDEPTSALDSISGFQVVENIIDFAKKNQMTLVIVSHDGELAKAFADQIIYLKKQGNKINGEKGQEEKR